MRTASLWMMMALVSACLAAEPKPVPNDEIDLVFLEASRPYRIRLHVQVEGNSYQDHWREIVVLLFRQLDGDGDGRISAKELQAAPSAEQFRLMVEGNPEIEASPPPTPDEFTDRSSQGISLPELHAYYLRTGVGPWQIRWASRPAAANQAFDDALFKHLQPKQDSILSSAEVQRAAEELLKLDADLDELVTISELAVGNFPQPFVTQRLAKNRESPIGILDPSAKGRQLFVAELLARYDANKDGKLQVSEVEFPASIASKADGNKNGIYDAEKLARWSDLPVDIELIIRSDAPSTEGAVILGSNQRTPGVNVSRSEIGSAVARFARDRIEVLPVDSAPPRRDRPPRIDRTFDELDRNKDGVLDHAEIYQPPFQLVPLLRLADRNFDDKLSKTEFDGFAKLRERLRTRLTTITIVARGNALFDLIDSDHDTRLSRRELRTAWERVRYWADPVTGNVARERLPYHYQVLVSRGALPAAADPGKGSLIRSSERRTAPAWFRKMDRNGDGDISRAEFLGNDAQFRRVDRDGDGLIDVTEATAAAPSK